jgi:hypothetical protein
LTSHRSIAPWNERHDIGPVDVDAIPRLREWAPAVQAAMLALGRRDKTTPTDPPLGLMGVNLRRIRLSDTDIPGGANLAGVLFWRSSLINAALGGADLRGASLGWTDLRHARLDRADLSNAHLRSADLRHATLKGANLGGANLRGADLRCINDLHQANLLGAKVNDKTKWLEGFDWRTTGIVLDSRP